MTTKPRLEELALSYQRDRVMQEKLVDYHIQEDRKTIPTNPQAYYKERMEYYKKQCFICLEAIDPTNKEETSTLLNTAFGYCKVIVYYQVKQIGE